MPNPEIMSFSNSESTDPSAEHIGEDLGTVQARGAMAMDVAKEQTGGQIFQNLSKEEFNSFDVSKLSNEQLVQAYHEVTALRAQIEQGSSAQNSENTQNMSATEVAQKVAEPEPTPQEPEIIDSERARSTLDKAKKNQSAKSWLTKKTMAVVIAASLLVGGAIGYYGAEASTSSAESGGRTTVEDNIDQDALGQETIENTELTGELSNGVHYDYREYADYDNKTSEYAFGYDKSEFFNDREATEDAWMEMANKSPEYISSYIDVLTDEEKAELGIDNMSTSELDDYLSNAQNIDGGAKQQKIFEKLNQIARDKENTRYEFYYENDTEYSYYHVFNDENKDGKYSPEEMRVYYSKVPRNGAPQVDVYRLINGQWTKVIDLNIQCGFQPNQETVPENMQLIPDNPDTGSETTGSEGTGSEGTGSEGTGSEGTGSEGTGNEGTDINPKDPDNLIRIDQNIDENISTDIGTENINHNPNPGVSEADKTNKPSGEEHKGTKPEIKQNDSSKSAEKVQPQKTENSHNQDKGGKNDKEYKPVQSKEEAQKKADSSATEVKNAPTDKQSVSNELKDLGID